MRRLQALALVLTLSGGFAGSLMAPPAAWCQVAEAEALANLFQVEPGARWQRVLDDAGDGELDQLDLLQAALLLSDESDFRKPDRSRFDLACQNAAREFGARSPHERAQLAHRLLHQHLLTGQYRTERSDVSEALQSGDYNCVSATLLYVALCRRFEIPAQAVSTSSHVFVRAYLPLPLEIETTCPTWFSSDVSSKARENALGSVNSESTNQRDLTDVQLLGKLCYNQGIALLEQQQFQRAVVAFHTAMQLDPLDLPTRNNLLAAINNWALAESDDGQYARSAQLLVFGLQLDARYEPFRANDLHVHHRWALALCERHQFADALELLQEGYRRRPDAELFRTGQLAVCRRWAEALLEEGRPREALAVFGRCKIGPQAVRQAQRQLLEDYLDQLKQQGRSDAARQLLAELADDPELLSLLNDALPGLTG